MKTENIPIEIEKLNVINVTWRNHCYIRHITLSRGTSDHRNEQLSLLLVCASCTIHEVHLRIPHSFLYHFIIVEKERRRTSFVSLSNVSALCKSTTSPLIFGSTLSSMGRPLGSLIATTPRSGSSYTQRYDILFLKKESLED